MPWKPVGINPDTGKKYFKWVGPSKRRGEKENSTIQFASTVPEGAILTHAQASSEALEVAEERREDNAAGSVESK